MAPALSLMAAPFTLPLRAVDALRRGDTIEAIRILRAATPLDLKSAKEAIDAYRRSPPPARPAIAPPGNPVPKTAADAQRIIEQSVRDERSAPATGFAAPQDPDARELTRFRDRAGSTAGRSPGEVPRSGSLWWIVILALVGYLLFPFLLRVLHV